MNAPTRLGLYALGLAVLFAGSLGAGRLVGPVGAPPAAEAGHDDMAPGGAEAGHEGTAEESGSHELLPKGLQVAEDGYRLAPVTTAFTPAAQTRFQFRILGPDGTPVVRYTPTHERDLHLIVVRRDLSGFQHVHPTLGPDGVWSMPLTVADAGQYRVFADFKPAGREDGLTLGVDVPAAGPYAPSPLPAPSRSVEVNGYTVELAGDLIAGKSSRVTLKISRAGQPVTDLQPYLGAYGHLVALRDGDLAYLHVHPESQGAGPEISFFAEVPSVGTYRLYLDFRHADAVRTAAFTATAARS